MVFSIEIESHSVQSNNFIKFLIYFRRWDTKLCGAVLQPKIRLRIYSQPCCYKTVLVLFSLKYIFTRVLGQGAQTGAFIYFENSVYSHSTILDLL